uniref:Peptidase C14 caspase domain-containing protein n=1 Tax=viral metagenome TaxID=1070528 RepID=A0A6C0E1L7_9ZZZZ
MSIKKAVLIGINYIGSDSRLNGCINDVRNIYKFLTESCGYKPADIRILTEEDFIKPSRKNMEDNMRWLVNGNKAGDTMFFYYSGHGSNISDRNGDETDGRDEVLVPLDYTTAGVITDDWILQNMVSNVVKDATLWAFTDCCHSGSMIDLKFNYKSLCEYKSGQVKKGAPYNTLEWTDKFTFSLERGRDIPGKVILFSGCQDAEVSADANINKQGQGAFSYCLGETLKQNLDDKRQFKKGILKLRNILKEVNCRLDINGFTGQNSQMSLSNVALLESTFDP